MANHEVQESEAGEEEAEEDQAERSAAIVLSLGPAPMAAPERTDRMKTVLADNAELCSPLPERTKRMTTVLMDKAKLWCSLCSRYLNRPIYQCGVGHFVCCGCCFKVRGNFCRACADRGVASPSPYAICPGLGYFFAGLLVPCLNAEYGCRRSTPYYEAPDHHSACEHAPCRCCAEEGCGFAGLPATQDRVLAVAEEKGDERCGVFVLSVGARGAASAVVSVACVRANTEAGPQYRCELWAQAPAPPGVLRRVGMETDVGSCAAPGNGKEDVLKEGSLRLLVAPEMMHGTDEASREMQLSVLIRKL